MITLSKEKINRNLFYITIILIPFSYFEVSGFRIIALIPAFLFVLIIARIFQKKSLKFDNSLFLFFPLFVVVATLSALSESSVFLSLIIFSSIIFMPYFVVAGLYEDMIINSKFLFVLTALFLAIGVVVQRIIFELTGLPLGKIDFYGGDRVGFGFIWMDYSFLSLFLVSAIPLLFHSPKVSNSMKLILTFILLAGSFVTSARTGLFSFGFVVVVYFFWTLVSGLYRQKINKKTLFFVLFMMLILFTALFFLNEYATRKFDFSDSSRFKGYITALQFWVDNFWFGSMFDVVFYKTNIEVIPHNFLVYILSQGGVLFFLFFTLWIVYLFFFTFKKLDLDLKLSLVIIFVGMNFIPSIFSAYFLAMFIAIGLLEVLKKKRF